MSLRTLLDLTIFVQYPKATSYTAHVPGPHFSTMGHQPLPQWCHSRVHFQLPTALPFLAVGPAKLGSSVTLHPGLASSHFHLQWVVRCQGLGFLLYPQLLCSWLGQWAGVWLQDLPWLLWSNPWHSLRASGSCWSHCCLGRILVYGHMKIKSPSFTFSYCLSKNNFHYQLWWGHTWNPVSRSGLSSTRETWTCQKE